MTLISAVKHGNEGCIISDFRITTSTRQYDTSLKWLDFDNSLMLYMAGKTNSLLPIIEEFLPTVYHDLCLENVDTEDGPVCNIIREIFSDKGASFESSIIGDYLDQPTNSFQMF